MGFHASRRRPTRWSDRPGSSPTSRRGRPASVNPRTSWRRKARVPGLHLPAQRRHRITDSNPRTAFVSLPPDVAPDHHLVSFLTSPRLETTSYREPERIASPCDRADRHQGPAVHRDRGPVVQNSGPGQTSPPDPQKPASGRTRSPTRRRLCSHPGEPRYGLRQAFPYEDPVRKRRRSEGCHHSLTCVLLAHTTRFETATVRPLSRDAEILEEFQGLEGANQAAIRFGGRSRTRMVRVAGASAACPCPYGAVIP